MKCIFCPVEIKTIDRFVFYPDKGGWAHLDCAIRDAEDIPHNSYKKSDHDYIGKMDLVVVKEDQGDHIHVMTQARLYNPQLKSRLEEVLGTGFVTLDFVGKQVIISKHELS